MSEPITAPGSTKIFRAAIWVAIGALIGAALVCVVWVLVGDSNGIVGRAFLTILLLAAFAGVSILESALAPRRAAWFALASMVSWVIVLLVGAFLIWMPEAPGGFAVGVERFFTFLLVVLILQGVLLHVRLFTKAFARYQTTFTSVVAYVTMGLLVILAVLLIVPLLAREFFDFLPIYWRVVVALAILVAVGTALVPLVNALFAPKRERRSAVATGYGPRPAEAAPGFAQPGHAGFVPASSNPPWPTYADGRTPLPVLPDGTPDWNAYYTGWPTYAQPPHGAPVAPADTFPEETAPTARASTSGQPSASPAPSTPPARPAPPAPPAPPSPSAPGYPDVPPAPPVPPQQ